MKYVLRILLVSICSLIGYGYYLQEFVATNGKIYIGLGVFIFAFLLMPLFIYQRYNNRIGDFIDRRMEKEQPNSIEKE